MTDRRTALASQSAAPPAADFAGAEAAAYGRQRGPCLVRSWVCCPT